MVKYMRFITYRNDMTVIILPQANPHHGLLLTDADGLGPVEASLSVSEPVIVDGGYFNHARVAPRNIVLTFTFTWEDIIEDPRHYLSKIFPLKRKLKMNFVTDRRDVFTWGYVEKNEPDIWSNMEQAQVSIICPDPWLYDEQNPNGVIGLTDDIPRLIFPEDTKDYTHKGLCSEDMPWWWKEVYGYEWYEFAAGEAPFEHDGILNVPTVGAATAMNKTYYSDRPVSTAKGAKHPGKRIVMGEVFDGGNRVIEVYNPGDVEVGCWIKIYPRWGSILNDDLDTQHTNGTVTIFNETSKHLPRQDVHLSKSAEWAQFAEEIDSSIILDMSRVERADKYVWHIKDYFQICTIPGQRSVVHGYYNTSTKEVKEASIVYAVDTFYPVVASGKWLTILPGKNWINISMQANDGDATSNLLYITQRFKVDLTFPICYEGI